ncbi:CHRD domain-containing protein [Formosa maritima]|uniref:CHRD domain-containing protein n=1 Tax=Formosa maritima TaxID=2592046 RepID=A0A5D0GAP4_9FLAO|nr:CHRD domain-containing protein [Formosa maritima]TYA56016.1 hypothetical protein FVF61_06960 [Formosa maritima]
MKHIFKSLFLVLPLVFLFNCSGDDNITPLPSSQISKSFSLSSIDDNNVSGIAKFIKNDDNSTTVELDFTAIPTGGSHPAHIHYNTAAEGGAIAITLGTVNGDTGFSTISFTTLDDGTPITYDELMSFDGYINVHESESQLNIIVAQGDIGQNELTGVSKTYTLGEKDIPGISGTAVFSERENGESLAVIQLLNTVIGELHPAHIHFNTAVEGGDIAFTFNSVNGETGKSYTNVKELDDATSFLYIDIIGFDGYINVHESDMNLDTIIAQGDIGENELTGDFISYNLNEVDMSGISGSATFYGRTSGEALAVILLQNTPIDGIHPAFMYSNDVDTPGTVLFSFSPVDGNTGISQTNLATLDDDTPFGFTDVLGVNGNIKVHLNNVQPTVIAQGNIGSND